MFCSHDHQSDPGRQALAAEQHQMDQPHRIQQDDTDRAPLDGDVQGLVVRIGDDLATGADVAGAGHGLFEQPLRRTGAVADQRRLAKNLSDFCQNCSRMPIDVGVSCC